MNSLFISKKSFASIPNYEKLVPVKMRANNAMLKNMVQDQTTALISEVRESIHKAKQSLKS
ncbi:MAG: hypothetical protein EHM12_01520 [Dehalococcoidia bacterium]|nr:MAG: hypothetical protein EHM12_01520 [Dehalococcoidia bacterium]